MKLKQIKNFFSIKTQLKNNTLAAARLILIVNLALVYVVPGQALAQHTDAACAAKYGADWKAGSSGCEKTETRPLLTDNNTKCAAVYGFGWIAQEASGGLRCVLSTDTTQTRAFPTSVSNAALCGTYNDSSIEAKWVFKDPNSCVRVSKASFPNETTTPKTTTTASTTTVDTVAPAPPGPGETSIADFLCTPDISLYTCINRLYRFGIVAGFFIAVVMIVIAGYLYMTGGEKGKEKGKSYISSTIVGIVILLTSYILLNQINPDLVLFKRISPLGVTKEDNLTLQRANTLATLWNTGPGGSGGTGTPGADIKQCPSAIVDIPRDISNSSDTERACPTLIEALRNLKSKGVAFEVTDAYGPGHDSLCHKQGGTCADIVPYNGSTWDNLCKAVIATGQFRLLNEYDGSNGYAQSCGRYVKTSLSSGNHLHIVLVGTADDIQIQE
jgi:hypothetical protein